MKALALILCLFSLAACGNKKSDKRPEIDRRTTCGEKSEKCLPDSILEIVSGHLPEKMKVAITFNEDPYELLNECEDAHDGYVVARGTTNFIQVFMSGYPVEMEAQVIITDLGANCDQDIIFYDELVTSEVIQANGSKPKMVFNLNN